MGIAYVLITADNIGLTLQNNQILDDISLTVSHNDFITIVGPNGAGKSSLINILVGLQQPTRGTLTKKTDLRIGYLPQQFKSDALLPVTVRYFLNLHNPHTKQELEAVFNLLKIPDSLLEQQIHFLSGGERQRILLARALLRKPELLILDEPAQNLDVSGQLNFYKQIESLYNQNRCAVVMVSHDLHLVMASSKKVICLYHHICCTGEPKHIVKDPKFIEIFGKDMADMMAIYHHEHDHQHSEHDHECNH